MPLGLPGNGVLSFVWLSRSARGSQFFRPRPGAFSTTSSLEGTSMASGVNFANAVAYGSGGYEPPAVAVADVNGDGKLDLLVANHCADDTCESVSVNECNRLLTAVAPQMLLMASDPCSIRLAKASRLMSNVSVTVHDSPVSKAAYQSQ